MHKIVQKGAKQDVEKGPNQRTCNTVQKPSQVNVGAEAKTMKGKQSEGQHSANIKPVSAQLLLAIVFFAIFHCNCYRV